MQIELNGLCFHLDILPGSEPDELRARIVDEAFDFAPQERPVKGTGCVIDLIADYSGLLPDESVARRISAGLATAAPAATPRDVRARRIGFGPDTGRDRPATRDFRVETRVQPHVVSPAN